MIDVIVLGGGIVGASAALMLAQKGQRVALVERDFCGSHSSGVNYGGVRRQGDLCTSCRCRSVRMNCGPTCRG